MATNKTQPTAQSVEDFLAGIADAAKRTDSERLCSLMTAATGEPAVMWGGSIVGFGTYHYRYATGREGDTAVVGFSPRAQAITLYLNGGFDEHADMLARLGKHTIGKGCLYIKRLSDVDEVVLVEMIEASLSWTEAQTSAKR